MEGSHLSQSADTFVLIAGLGTNLTELQWGGEDREQLTAPKPYKDTVAVSMGTEKDQKTLVRAAHFVTPERSARRQREQLFHQFSGRGRARESPRGSTDKHLQSHPALREQTILM